MQEAVFHVMEEHPDKPLLEEVLDTVELSNKGKKGTRLTFPKKKKTLPMNVNAEKFKVS